MVLERSFQFLFQNVEFLHEEIVREVRTEFEEFLFVFVNVIVLEVASIVKYIVLV